MIVHCTAVNNNGGKRKYSTVDRIYYGERFSCGRLNESNQTVSKILVVLSLPHRARVVVENHNECKSSSSKLAGKLVSGVW